MSRSKKKSKIRGVTTAASEKENKQKANRKLRRLTKEALSKGAAELPEKREASDVWDFDKDGKVYDPALSGKGLRK